MTEHPTDPTRPVLAGELGELGDGDTAAEDTNWVDSDADPEHRPDVSRLRPAAGRAGARRLGPLMAVVAEPVDCGVPAYLTRINHLRPVPTVRASTELIRAEPVDTALADINEPRRALAAKALPAKSLSVRRPMRIRTPGRLTSN